MVFLRKDQAKELLEACEIVDPRFTILHKEIVLKQKLAIRYMMLNGLSPMELCHARIEHLDPVNCELFMPHRHWKNNCITAIERETVRLQIMYTGSRKKGPLLRSNKTGGHYTTQGIWDLVKRIARNSNIVNKECISPLILKRTYARIYLKGGGTVPGLQQSFSHKHLNSTAHYLKFVLDDVKEEKARMMDYFEDNDQQTVRKKSRYASY